MSDIEQLNGQALADIAAAATPDALEHLRVSLLGKSGSITAQLKSLGALPAEERKAAGEAINRVRDAVGEALAARKTALDDAALDARLAGETIDITLPGRDPERGGEHVLGRFTIPETDVYSTCLAVQNLWLAARAEGLGMGWVSLFDPEALAQLLDMPPGAKRCALPAKPSP